MRFSTISCPQIGQGPSFARGIPLFSAVTMYWEVKRLEPGARRLANLVNKEGLGFESDQNEVEILIRSGQRTHVGPASKKEVAERILDQVARLHVSLRAADLSA